MDNSHTSMPFNGQIPNLNMSEINGLMQQFTHLLEGDFMRSMQQLSQLQNQIPNMNGMPIMPVPPNVNMGQINGMIARLQSLLNHDFMRSMYNLQANNYSNARYSATSTEQNTSKTVFPIQLWETEQHLYVLASIPGLKSSNEIKVQFPTDDKVLIRTKMPTHRPAQKSHLLHSEFLSGALEREVSLSQPVSTKSYSASYVNGLYTLTLHKQERDIDIPIFDT